MQTEAFIEFEDSSHHINDSDELTKKMSENGYLFFRKLADQKKVDEVRYGIIRILKRHGLVDKTVSSEPKWSGQRVDGNALLCDGEIGMEIAKLRSIRELYNSEELIQVQRRILGGEVFPWVENADRVRAHLPGMSTYTAAGQIASTVTVAHQDHFPFRNKYGGHATFNTTWMPLMDIDGSVGGLTIMKNSHAKGFHKHFMRNGEVLGALSSKKELGEWLDSGAVVAVGEAEPDDNVEWLRSDYHVGDILIFHRLMVHKGLPNMSDKIRLSTDFRYQLKGTYTSWKAWHRLPWTLKFGAEVRRNLNELGVKSELADKTWEVIHNIQGPSRRKGNTIKSRIQKIVNSIKEN